MSAHAFSRSMQKQQTRLTSPLCRTLPGQSAGTHQAHPGTTGVPVSMPSNRMDHVINGSLTSSSRSPPDVSSTPFPHRSPRRSSTNAARGGLEPPPVGRPRRAIPSSSAQHRISNDYLHIAPPTVKTWCATNVGGASVGRLAERCCAGDEGWPFGVALRGEASNHLMLRWLKTVVVSDEEKAPVRRQVGTRKTSASEPLLTCRNQ